MALALALAVLAAACGGDDGGGDDDTGGEGAAGDGATTDATADVELPPDYEDHTSELYAGDANWLCKPGIADDVCSRDLDATAVAADGSTEVQEHEVADDQPIDCFYIYPTISFDEGPNADLEISEPEEIFVAYNQAARLTSECRVYAPVYRQITLSAIGGGAPPAEDGTDPRAVAYGDVVDAFRHYVAQEGEGRGFVLIGHSQGAGHLNRLIQDEIDGEPLLRDRLVSAYLLGSSVGVPEGEVVGGDFDDVPLCEAADQTGCVVSYASFRSTVPPPDDSLFGRVRGDSDLRAACVNPAAIEGDAGELEPYFLTELPEGTLVGGPDGQPAFADDARNDEITTPWVTFPGFIEAECVDDGEFSYLELTVDGDPEDPRVDDIGGDLSPEWGMHLVDVNVAMGNIVDLVGSQAEAYTAG
ncbi:MAG: DUF3089 domain-containing protein [Acidimicrobiia bacterium]